MVILQQLLNAQASIVATILSTVFVITIIKSLLRIKFKLKALTWNAIILLGCCRKNSESRLDAPTFSPLVLKGTIQVSTFFFYHCAGLPSLEGCNDHVPMPSSIQVFKQEKNNALLFKGHVSSFSFLCSTSNCR